MGGRFDATNIVSPAATAITSVDLDHTQFLGKTLPEIAVEKAGVVRSDGLVVTGETKPQALDVIRKICRERNARLVEVSQDVSMHVALRDGLTELVMTTPHRTYGPLVLSLRGRHQAHNAGIAVRLLEELDGACTTPGNRHPIPKRAIEAGLVRTQWPGRLELIRAGERAWALLDAAHNVAAAAALGRYLEETYPGGLPLILAAMRDKDVAGILQQLKPVASRIVCTAPHNPRAWPAEELSRIAAQHCPGIPRTVAESPAAALEEAWQDNDTICVAGSVYLIGEVREILVSRTTSFASPPGGPE
jgi:dihydrofolate synthase/folylpolyglutamate synthase